MSKLVEVSKTIKVGAVLSLGYEGQILEDELSQILPLAMKGYTAASRPGDFNIYICKPEDKALLDDPNTLIVQTICRDEIVDEASID